MNYRFLFFWMSLFFLAFFNRVSAITVSNIDINPDLDISLFSSYTITADVADYNVNEPVSLTLKGVNGDGNDCWQYYVDGTCASSILTFNMTFDSGITWKKTFIRPDYIYPQIFFAPSVTSWNNSPSNIDIRRNQYHLLHFTNLFTMVDNMSFWIELNTTPLSVVNSADLLVYLVNKGHNSNFFNSDWRNSANVELVGSINRSTGLDHIHNSNSGHYLITLATNSDGTIGSKNLDINDDFWIILYANSPNTNRGWHLKYHESTLCNNSNGWFLGNQIGWATTPKSGCPDIHTHMARRSEKADGLIATTTAGSVSSAQIFSFGILPNLPPNQSSFITPTIGGTYAGNLLVNWATSTDANIADSITYDLYLVDSNGNDILPILTASTTLTTYTLDTTGLSNGNYSLRGLTHDGVNAGVAFNLVGNFTIDNTSPIQTLTNINTSSDNSNNSVGNTGDTVTISFTSSGSINTPTVSIYSGGMEVANTVTVTNIGSNSWSASYMVSSSDTEGALTFSINSTSLDREYFETTDGSTVLIDITTASAPVHTPGSNFIRRLLNLKSIFGSNIEKIQSITSVNKKYLFEKNLKIRIVHNDVKELQRFLNSQGFVLTISGLGSPGQETNFFGGLTRKALIEFQKKNNIKPSVGFFGPITRQFVNSQ
ncbi:MAG: peptidoglycan-binding domain-containing protein [Patescibacteria group bacterium]